MANVRKSALVPYSSSAMYALVADIESYSHFLPWCSHSEILYRDRDQVRAVIGFARAGIRKSFTTLNRMQKDKMIEIRLVEGPFHHLHGFWRFDSLRPDACKVSLDLDFAFSGQLVNRAIGPVFHQIANSLVDSFCRRATIRYGRG